MKNKTSVLKAILDDVYVAGSFEDAMAVIQKRLDEPDSPIRDADKRMILIKSMQCQGLVSLQKYITNSYFKFSGMGV
jgi:hypothetical protein